MTRPHEIGRGRILRVMQRWDEAKHGPPSTWEVLRAACLLTRHANDLDHLAGEGAVEVAGRARDGSRLWRLSPAGRSAPDAET